MVCTEIDFFRWHCESHVYSLLRGDWYLIYPPVQRATLLWGVGPTSRYTRGNVFSGKGGAKEKSFGWGGAVQGQNPWGGAGQSWKILGPRWSRAAIFPGARVGRGVHPCPQALTTVGGRRKQSHFVNVNAMLFMFKFSCIDLVCLFKVTSVKSPWSIGPLWLYAIKKVEIILGVTNTLGTDRQTGRQTDGQTVKDRASQLVRRKSGALALQLEKEG